MKRILKIIFTLAGILFLLIIMLTLFLIWAAKQPAVKEKYYETVVSDKPLEQTYTKKGPYEVSYAEYDAGDEKIGRFEIWYPAETETTDAVYPLVVMANGTGVPASKYEAVFEHLASWGFIVIGNEDGESWNGLSSAESLDFMLENNRDPSSMFYGMLDTDHIGIAGHSQGGVGAVNAVTEYENGSCYKAVYAASATHIDLANALHWPYDVSKIRIPYFMTAGTLQADAGNEQNAGIAPLSSLQENYASLPDDIMKLYARRVNTDHGDMLANADGYMTAWFMYHLKDDEEAGKVFIGEHAEILDNGNWQDIEKNH
ncbi:MAG: alpha/beta hydrolase [Eubacteriales bacterium]